MVLVNVTPVEEDDRRVKCSPSFLSRDMQDDKTVKRHKAAIAGVLTITIYFLSATRYTTLIAGTETLMEPVSGAE